MGHMPRYQATLLIELKKGILDPQGRAVEGVRVGKVLEIVFPAENLLEAEEKAKAMGALLANPVMEVYALEALKELP